MRSIFPMPSDDMAGVAMRRVPIPSFPEASDTQNPSSVRLLASGAVICYNNKIPINIFIRFVPKVAVKTVEKYLKAELLHPVWAGFRAHQDISADLP